MALPVIFLIGISGQRSLSAQSKNYAVTFTKHYSTSPLNTIGSTLWEFRRSLCVSCGYWPMRNESLVVVSAWLLLFDYVTVEYF